MSVLLAALASAPLCLPAQKMYARISSIAGYYRMQIVIDPRLPHTKVLSKGCFQTFDEAVRIALRETPLTYRYTESRDTIYLTPFVNCGWECVPEGIDPPDADWK